ncbi:hypothetical protein COU17_03430 [Candidatus Kaiserbacteria bacterium CG10_big_fil_rev_8_21_14_0_10_49_17]|uniref:Sugar ABC transporter substrate-binding protein n=1 Tax=Candidatus Kaiserbacteria bacterium CG10_big_fil_rev_8_21_14_0_10_49_17 TaxID=1974609 RepID=A0A2M6WDL7_9BACT|nr:MAG: hypothetical protein COU17_03430 [Candidatus Kaiserbacteria bacterium CG10_big_fil_rev_8_21_14_0_10_49_17]
MKKLSIFQVGVIGFFSVMGVIGVLVFAGVGGLGRDTVQVGQVTVWGTYSKTAMLDYFSALAGDNTELLDSVEYVEKNPRTYEQDLIEALAAQRGPDVFFLNQALAHKHRDKLLPASYDFLSERDYKDTFIEEGELFLTDAGVLAFPISIDPMVLYWNRSIFSGSGVARAPRYWDEVQVLASERLTTRDAASNIFQSTIALGEYQNIAHAKEILALLMMQAGSSIVATDTSGRHTSDLDRNDFANTEAPAVTALRFYTDFSNPSKTVYTWNRALPEARAAFIGGKLAMYLGFASEIQSIRAQNPNLNFDVALAPQARDASVVSYGRMTGLAIPKGSSNPDGALQLIALMVAEEGSILFSELTGLPSPRRDILSRSTDDPFDTVFYNAAIAARNFRDPDPVETEALFRGMIESVTSGRFRISEAISEGSALLNSLLER